MIQISTDENLILWAFDHAYTECIRTLATTGKMADFHALAWEWVREQQQDRRYRMQWRASSVDGRGVVGSAIVTYKGVKYYLSMAYDDTPNTYKIERD